MTENNPTPDPFPWGDVFDAPVPEGPPYTHTHTPDRSPEDQLGDGTDDDVLDLPPAPELSEEERAEVDRIEAAPAADLDAEIAGQGPHGNATTMSLGEALAAQDPALADPAPFTPEADLEHREAPGATYGAEPTVAEPVAEATEAEKAAHREAVAALNPDPAPTAEPVQWIGIDGVEASLDNLAELATRNATCRAATDTIVDAVRKRAAKRAETRPDKVRNTSDIRRELVGVTRDGDVLADLAAVFTAGAAESKAIVGDLMDELPVRGDKPRMSASVADGDGFELKITRSKRTELKTDDEVIDDVLVAFLIRVADDKRKGENPPAHLALTAKPMTTYAAGVRDAIGALRNVLSASPDYRSTALNALVKVIQSLNEDELAKRLERAFGRVEKGEATIKYNRVPLDKPAADETPAEVGTDG